MLFNSIEYLIFFPVVVAIYFSIPHKTRTVFLLLSSYFFYMSWKPTYGGLILASTCIDYFSGIKMEDNNRCFPRSFYLIFSLIGNLSILFTFKYFNFFTRNFTEIIQITGFDLTAPTLNVILPVGISFYTFQSLSYTIDTYLQKRKPEQDFLTFALYVSFFPQLVAGPIERSTNLLPQFYEKNHFKFSRTIQGLKLAIWGMFKKVVIADQVSLYVDQVYGTPIEFSGIHYLTATLFFSFQIYCDFSGYSDIAIGSAKVLGFDIMENFRRPYFSKSIPEFWRRWHISLSTWFKDYLYIPLGGNRVGKIRFYFNIFVVFLLSGLWHGASWTFVVWGALHGIFYMVSSMKTEFWEISFLPTKGKLLSLLGSIIRMGITFFLVTISWVYFRAQTIDHAHQILSGMFTGLKNWNLLFFNSSHMLIRLTSPVESFSLSKFLVCCLSILFLLVIEFIQGKSDTRKFMNDQPMWLRWLVYNIIVIAIFGVLLFGQPYQQQQFIYFQF